MKKKILTSILALSLVFAAASCKNDEEEKSDTITFTLNETTSRWEGSVDYWGDDIHWHYFKLDESTNAWEYGTFTDTELSHARGNYEVVSESPETLKLNREKIRDFEKTWEFIDSPKAGWKTITIKDNSFTVVFYDSDWDEF